MLNKRVIRKACLGTWKIVHTSSASSQDARSRSRAAHGRHWPTIVRRTCERSRTTSSRSLSTRRPRTIATHAIRSVLALRAAALRAPPLQSRACSAHASTAVAKAWQASTRLQLAAVTLPRQLRLMSCAPRYTSRAATQARTPHDQRRLRADETVKC